MKIESFRDNRGITLVALVITIIVLLILAGVSLNLAVGGDGIVNKAIDASTAYTEAQIKETIDSAYQQAVIGQLFDSTDEKIRVSIENDLKKHYESANVTTVSGGYEVDLGDKGTYTVSESGTKKKNELQNLQKIDFSINGTLLRADKNSTWLEWCMSSDNTVQAWPTRETNVWFIHCNKGYFEMDYSETIESGKNYSVLSGTLAPLGEINFVYSDGNYTPVSTESNAGDLEDLAIEVINNNDTIEFCNYDEDELNTFSDLGYDEYEIANYNWFNVNTCKGKEIIEFQASGTNENIITLLVFYNSDENELVWYGTDENGETSVKESQNYSRIKIPSSTDIDYGNYGNKFGIFTFIVQ